MMPVACSECGAHIADVCICNIRYPYTHHGPAVHGDKLTDFLISEANMREDGLLQYDNKEPDRAD